MKDILKEGAKLEVRKVDTKSPFYIALLESTKKQQEEIKKFNEIDTKQLFKRCTI